MLLVLICTVHLAVCYYYKSIECRITLKHACDLIITYTEMHRTDLFIYLIVTIYRRRLSNLQTKTLQLQKLIYQNI